MDSASKFLERIKKEGIDPTPGWVFKAKNGFIWGGFIVTIFIGASAFSVILYAIQQSDFDLVNHIRHSGLEMFLALLPIIWLVLILIFLALSIVSVKNSNKGYKLEWLKVINIVLLFSVVLGTLLFISGGAQRLETAFGNNLPGYESINKRKIEMWNNPEEGFLAGEIVFSGGDILKIRSFDGLEWSVEIEKAFIAPILGLEEGEKVKVIGTVQGKNNFLADEIRPWGGEPGRGEGRNLNRSRNNK